MTSPSMEPEPGLDDTVNASPSRKHKLPDLEVTHNAKRWCLVSTEPDVDVLLSQACSNRDNIPDDSETDLVSSLNRVLAPSDMSDIVIDFIYRRWHPHEQSLDLEVSSFV